MYSLERIKIVATAASSDPYLILSLVRMIGLVPPDVLTKRAATTLASQLATYVVLGLQTIFCKTCSLHL